MKKPRLILAVLSMVCSLIPMSSFAVVIRCPTVVTLYEWSWIADNGGVLPSPEWTGVEVSRSCPMTEFDKKREFVDLQTKGFDVSYRYIRGDPKSVTYVKAPFTSPYADANGECFLANAISDSHCQDIVLVFKAPPSLLPK